MIENMLQSTAMPNQRTSKVESAGVKGDLFKENIHAARTNGDVPRKSWQPPRHRPENKLSETDGVNTPKGQSEKSPILKKEITGELLLKVEESHVENDKLRLEELADLVGQIVDGLVNKIDTLDLKTAGKSAQSIINSLKPLLKSDNVQEIVSSLEKLLEKPGIKETVLQLFSGKKTPPAIDFAFKKATAGQSFEKALIAKGTAQTIKADPQTIKADPQTIKAAPQTIKAAPQTIKADPQTALDNKNLILKAEAAQVAPKQIKTAQFLSKADGQADIWNTEKQEKPVRISSHRESGPRIISKEIKIPINNFHDTKNEISQNSDKPLISSEAKQIGKVVKELISEAKTEKLPKLTEQAVTEKASEKSVQVKPQVLPQQTKSGDIKLPLTKGNPQVANDHKSVLPKAAVPEIELKAEDKIKVKMTEIVRDEARTVKTQQATPVVPEASVKKTLGKEVDVKNDRFQKNFLGPKAVPEKEVKSSTEQQGQSQQEKGQSELSTPKRSLNFIKKLKAILKQNPSESQFEVENQQTQKTQNQPRLQFVNKIVSGRLVHQIVEKLQSMLSESRVLSTTVDIQSLEFGDLKLSAESTGARISVNLSTLNQQVRADLLALKAELENDLKQIGFENIDLSFNADQEGENPFQEEMDKKKQQDQVKLPGDVLGDLAQISDWLRQFEAMPLS